MSSLSMPQLGRDIVESYRKASVSVGETLRLDPSQNTDSVRRRAARSARELIRFTLSRRGDARAVWQGALEVIEDGLNGEQSREVMRVVQDVIDRWFGLARKSRDWWRDVEAATGAKPELLDELDAAEKDVQDVRSAAEKVLGFLTRPRPPIDPARLEQGIKDIAEGRFKTAEQAQSSGKEGG
jgi:hypothetical protein